MNQTELQTKWKPASDPAFGKCFVYIRETSRELWRAVSWEGLPAPPDLSNIPNERSIVEKWRYFVDFLHDFQSFSFQRRFMYLRQWNCV